MNADDKHFTVFRRQMHWSVAIFIVAMFSIGICMVSTIAPTYVSLLVTQKTLGLALFVLAVVRLAVRARSEAPPLPSDLSEPIRLAAHLSHYALYALMFALPLLGWGMLSAGGYPIMLCGDIQLPAILPLNEDLHILLLNSHFYLAFTFVALVLAHVVAALIRELIHRNRVLNAMAPVESGASGDHKRWAGGTARIGRLR